MIERGWQIPKTAADLSQSKSNVRRETTMNNIQKTEDYSLFKRIDGNRTINKAQVQKLYDSISADPELTKAAPIIVNDKMEVVDGQHRLEALKRLNLPVYYLQVNGLNLSEVQKLNSATKVWTPYDYAKSFAELKNKNYITYLEFRHKYHLSHEVLVKYMAGGKDITTTMFRAGKFRTDNLKEADKLCGQLSDLCEFYKQGNSKAFAFAFKKIAINPEYDHEKMVAKIKQFGDKFLKPTPFVEDYLRQLERMYNHYVKADTERIRAF